MPGFVVLVAELTNVVRGQDTVGIDVAFTIMRNTPYGAARFCLVNAALCHLVADGDARDDDLHMASATRTLHAIGATRADLDRYVRTCPRSTQPALAALAGALMKRLVTLGPAPTPARRLTERGAVSELHPCDV